MSISYGKAVGKIRELASYRAAKIVYGRDSVLSDSVHTAGFWATFDGILQFLISNTGTFSKNKVVIDSSKAISLFRDFRRTLSQKSLKFEASARLMGVTLTSKSFNLPDGITLSRLTRKERNEKQPAFEAYLPSGWEEEQLSDHPAELRVSLSVPVNHKQKSAFFKAKNNAESVARQMFNKVVEAILIATSGKAKLSAIKN